MSRSTPKKPAKAAKPTKLAKPAKAATGERATYLYCVVKGSAKPLGRMKGLAGAGAPRTLDVGDGYHVIVCDVPLALYSAEAIEAKLHDLEWVSAAASAHEAVVESAGAGGTVVPMKLFTIFSSDERAADHVRKMKKSLAKVVAKIAGCEEWGLRILFDEAGAAKAKERRDAARPKAPVSGTSFLLRKKETDQMRRRLTSAAKEVVDDLFVRLEQTAKNAVRRPPPSRELAGQVLLDAVFLVPETRTAKFKTTVATHAKELADEGYHVTLTGPWPAYSFIEGR